VRLAGGRRPLLNTAAAAPEFAFDSAAASWQTHALFFGPRICSPRGPSAIPTEADLVKPELGTKRLCPTCGGKFYDLHKSPAECPYCEAVFNPEDLVRGRRTSTSPSRPAAAEAKPAEKKPAKAEPEEDEDIDDLEVGEVETEEDEDDEVLEDASDLGEDDEDVAEVMDNVERPEGGD
jgi:uncharacterized protein (TIGR02300 family)